MARLGRTECSHFKVFLRNLKRTAVVSKDDQNYLDVLHS